MRSVWQELKLDNFEDVHELKELAEITKAYHQMMKLTDKLKVHYNNLPEDERQRLHIEAHLLGNSEAGDKIVHCLDTLSDELESLVSHRQHVRERNHANQYQTQLFFNKAPPHQQ